MLLWTKHKKGLSKKSGQTGSIMFQKREDVTHQYVKTDCTKNQSPGLQFFSPHNKPHGARGLG